MSIHIRSAYMASRKDNHEGRLNLLLGANIAERRKELGWTQAELAERIGVDTETISRFERGSNLPSLQRLEKLADTLQIPMYQLVASISSRHDDQSYILDKWMSALSAKDREFAMNTLKQLCIHLAKETQV